MGGGIAPGLPLRIPKMRHPRKLRKTKLHIIYLKGTHKKAGPKKNFRVAVLVQGGNVGCYFGNRFWYRGWYCGCTVGIIFGTEGVLWESFLVQGGELWGTGGNHFLVKRGVQWVAFLVQGVVVWVYCGKQFLVLRVCTVDGIFGTGVDVWVYCGKQLLVLRVRTVDGILVQGW